MNIKPNRRVIAWFPIIAASVALSFGAEKPEAEAKKSAEQWLALAGVGVFHQVTPGK